MTETIEELQYRVLASAGATEILESTAALPFEDDAVAAIRRRVAAAYEDPEALRDALDRAEGLTLDQIAALIAEDRARWDDLLAEDHRREISNGRLAA